jgi:hypothetical protein
MWLVLSVLEWSCHVKLTGYIDWLNWLVILTFRSNMLLLSSGSKCLEWRCLIFFPSFAIASNYYPASCLVNLTLKVDAASSPNIWPKYSLPHCCLLLRRFVVHTSVQTPDMVTGFCDLSEPSTHLMASLHFSSGTLFILVVLPFDAVQSRLSGRYVTEGSTVFNAPCWLLDVFSLFR